MNIKPEDTIGLMILAIGLGMLPFFVMTLTSFVKISVVLTLVRNALGVQQAPPTMAINAMALIMTAYIMAPMGQVAAEAAERLRGASLTDKALAAYEAVRPPYTQFLAAHASSRERQFFLKSAGLLWPQAQAERLKDDDFAVLAPAFVVTELTEAFRIGFILYLAFVAVDLVVANVLVALGLSQASPTNIAIPFKLMLFVALDGWAKLLHGLVTTYR